MPIAPTSPGKQSPGSKRFPLVHKLVQFADIRRYYAEMREALKDSNRQAGADKGWVTRWKNKAEGIELERKQLEVERDTLVHDKKVLSEQLRTISEQYQGIGTILAKLEHFENAVDGLRRMKLVPELGSIDPPGALIMVLKGLALEHLWIVAAGGPSESLVLLMVLVS